MQEITTTTKVYTFDELSDEAKEKARDWYREGAYDYEWWEFTYEDAATMGLRITSFDLDRNRHAEGEFMVLGGAEQVAGNILRDHGKDCETYKTTQEYRKEREKIETKFTTIEKDEAYDDAIGLCEDDYLRSLLEDYSIMLQNEYEYLGSNESVDENIRINEYTFTEDGKHFG